MMKRTIKCIAIAAMMVPAIASAQTTAPATSCHCKTAKTVCDQAKEDYSFNADSSIVRTVRCSCCTWNETDSRCPGKPSTAPGEKVFRQVGESVKGGITSAGHSVGTAAKKVGEGGKNIFRKIGAAGKAVGKGISQTVKNVGEAVSETK